MSMTFWCRGVLSRLFPRSLFSNSSRLESELMVPAANFRPITEPDALKMAIAVAFAISRTKRLDQQSAAPSSLLADAEIHRWKRKAEERKRDLISLREEIKRLEEGGEVHTDPVPQIVSCRCHFFEGCGLSGSRATDSIGDGANCGDWIDDALRRRFLRHVRWREKQRRPEGSTRKTYYLDLGNGDEVEWLCTSVDFLLELCGNKTSEINNFNSASLFHQATDSILASLKKIPKQDNEIVENVISRLLTSLLQRMWPVRGENGTSVSSSMTDIHIQHLIRKLGEEPYVGQRALILITQKMSFLSDSLLVADPFDEAFPNIHDYLYTLMQLTEFIVQDNLQAWTKHGDLDNNLFEEWLRSILQARKALEALENSNGLYLSYLERIVGVTSRQAGQLSDYVATHLSS